MTYNYKIISKIDPNLLESELIKVGLDGWQLIHVQPIQEIKQGMQLNGNPIVKLTYQLILSKRIWPDS